MKEPCHLLKIELDFVNINGIKGLVALCIGTAVGALTDIGIFGTCGALADTELGDMRPYLADINESHLMQSNEKQLRLFAADEALRSPIALSGYIGCSQSQSSGLLWVINHVLGHGVNL